MDLILGLLKSLKIRAQYIKSLESEEQPQNKVYIDWRWPLPCVHSVMIVFSAQLAEGGGVHVLPLYPMT